MSSPHISVDHETVLAAASRLANVATKTPLIENQKINTLAGRRVLIKAECLQRTGSFKFRGAWSAITALDEQQRQKGVIAYSSGNHAQAIALCAQLHNISATIVMPNDAPKLKLNNTRGYGAEVVLYDRPGGEQREKIGDQIAGERGLSLIKPFDNPYVIAGQGTVGLEIAEQAQEYGVSNAEVLVCCGGGGLTSGIATALAHTAPGMRVRPVEPETSDDVCRSLLSGKREHNTEPPTSICDAIVTPSSGDITFPIMQKYCGIGMTVTDTQALQAMAIALIELKLVAEPGGAVALAAALFQPDEINTDTVVCVISGGNTDPEMIERALQTYSTS